jgi:methyl-accepting chemotaxis protein
MLEAIIESISHINEMNAQVAAATDEQSAVANEVNRSITSIKQVAEQSAHASSDTLGAVGELQALALRLEQKVATFQV